MEKEPIQFDPIYQFNIVLLNEDNNYTIINLTLRGITAGFNIKTPSDEELENLPVYDIASDLFWDPTRKFHA